MREMTVQFSHLLKTFVVFIWKLSCRSHWLWRIRKRRQIHPIIWFVSAVMHAAIVPSKVLKIKVVNIILMRVFKIKRSNQLLFHVLLIRDALNNRFINSTGERHTHTKKPLQAKRSGSRMSWVPKLFWPFQRSNKNIFRNSIGICNTFVTVEHVTLNDNETFSAENEKKKRKNNIHYSF